MTARYPIGRTSRSGFTLIEVVIVIGVLMVLIGLFAPTAVRARAHSKAVKCRAQLWQIGVAIADYASRSGSVYPSEREPFQWPDRTWPELLFGQQTPRVIVCPTADNDREWVSYQINIHLLLRDMRRLGRRAVMPTSEIVLAGESWPGTNYLFSVPHVPENVGTSWDPARHGPQLRSNYLWLDFHVSNDPPRRRPEAADPWYIVR